mgnify:CR=1 FL=1
MPISIVRVLSISIHALVKRATGHTCDNGSSCHISIHALVKRATIISAISVAEEKISIHALVKRATIFLVTFLGIVCYFNPRPREEGDKCYPDSDVHRLDFNPRPREEGDIQIILAVCLSVLFQSTPS